MTILPTDPTTLAWARNFWAMLKDGGVWGVPRSGLLYRRQGDTLVLYARMPWQPGMPISAVELREQQQADHDGNVQMFAAISVVVDDVTKEGT